MKKGRARGVQIENTALYAAMVDKGINVLALSEKSGVARQTIYRVLKGCRAKYETVFKLGNALGIRPSSLLKLKGD